VGSIERVMEGSCTLEQLIAFGEVSGSRGPIHTDRELATRLFGGPVVQAALLMEYGLAGVLGLGRWPVSLAKTSIDARFLKLVLTDEPFAVDLVSLDPSRSLGLEVNNSRGCAVSMQIYDREVQDA
jgi:acyl dehydratase